MTPELPAPPLLSKFIIRADRKNVTSYNMARAPRSRKVLWDCEVQLGDGGRESALTPQEVESAFQNEGVCGVGVGGSEQPVLSTPKGKPLISSGPPMALGPRGFGKREGSCQLHEGSQMWLLGGQTAAPGSVQAPPAEVANWVLLGDPLCLASWVLLSF